MRNSIVVLLKFWLIATSPLAAAAQHTNAVVSVLSDTNAVYNFKVALNFPKTTFTNGEPVFCLAGLTNVSETPTIVFPSLFELNLKFYVTNANGVRIAPAPWDYAMVPISGPILISPHNVEPRFQHFSLSDYFQLTPGTYTICVVREMGYPFNDIMYTSKVVTIKVLESPVPATTNAPGATAK